MIKKKTKKNGKIVFLEKNMLNRIEVLSSKVLIDSYISCDEFVLLNNILKEYDVEEKSKFKSLIQFIKDFNLFTKQFHNVV